MKNIMKFYEFIRKFMPNSKTLIWSQIQNFPGRNQKDMEEIQKI